MSRKIMTIRPFTRYGRTIPVNSYMNVDKDLYDELVMRKRVAVSMAQYEAMKSAVKAQHAVQLAEDIEATAQRIADQEREQGVQHVVVHHVSEEEE